MKVKRTGIRDAKAHLSRLLRDVNNGTEWLITDHGKPVARLVPLSPQDLPLSERIRRMEEGGLIEPLTARTRKLPAPLPLKKGMAQHWLQDDRNA